MLIDKETLEIRKSVYARDIEQLMSRVQALHGAIQDCDFWIQYLESEEVEEEVKELAGVENVEEIEVVE